MAWAVWVSADFRGFMGFASDCEFQMIGGIYHKSRGVKGAMEKRFCAR